MRIKSIKIKNYRSFNKDGLELEFPEIKSPFSLVGHNNSGKSNFINALLFGLSVKSVSYSKFCIEDFYLKDFSKEILVEVCVDPPLKSSDAYNRISEMPIFQLRICVDEGIVETSHYCCNKDGKPIFNPQTVKRSKKKKYTKEELETLSLAQKQGAETVYKWKSKIPVYYIDPTNIYYQLRINRNTLLGKVMLEVKKDFESKNNVVKKANGISDKHVGTPRIKIFENALKYLEEHILSTENLEKLIEKITEVIQKQLELEDENFSLKFGLPSPDIFFDNLTFYISDNPKKPQLPIDFMGSGFVSLFVVALFRAIVNSDEGNSIFIIEEPETFLHEHFQEYFYKVLCELAQNKSNLYNAFQKVYKPL